MLPYLTVKDLQDRLRGRGLKVSGTRDELMDRCNLNGLVTAHERLTQRNMVQSRRAVLEYELQLVGCELRSDSQLCDCYIDRGEGDPVTIAGIMAEMKFFHEHTDYSDILDDLYDEAWEAYEKARNFYGDYDVSFIGNFYDHEKASSQAKEEALDCWMADQPSLEDLPETLRQRVLPSLCRTRISAWLANTFGEWANNTRVRAFVDFIESQTAIISEVTEPWMLTDEVLARVFGVPLQEYIKPLKVEKEISDFVHDTLKAAGFSKDYELLDVVLACINKRVMMPLFREAFKEAVKAVTKIPGKPQSFSAQVLRLFGQNANPSSKTLKQRMGGTWHCTLCKYSTTPGDLRVHWAKNHNVNTLADISAVKYVHTESSFLLLVDEACVKIIARHHAARIIQRRWRLAISSPAFEVCRRRLLREVSELEIMS